ncbi:MAG: DegV family EDD domain-containing protein [Legionellales bacterium]|nr:DegV family EDD domain-containing protein [Legionellales bacterium]
MNGHTWYSAVCQGAMNLCDHIEYLNKINIFPIADGDTGNNLQSLMRSLLDYGQANESFYLTAESLAKAALIGARGNSGTLLCQFYFGLLNPQQKPAVISITEFCDSVINAAQSARQAIENPTDGTMLSIFDAWANGCKQKLRHCKNFQDFFNHTMDLVQKALNNTQYQLDILSRAGVVDAGAQGIVFFIQGITDYFNQNFYFQKSQAQQYQVSEKLHEVTTKPQFRYCSEVIVNHLTCSIDEIKTLLRPFGDSLAIAGDSQQARFHFHTNDPHVFIEILENHADIKQQKVDDMLKQFELQTMPPQKIALVTDSNADIPRELLDKYHIHVLPLEVFIDDQAYLDRLTLQSDRVYQALLQKKRLQTSSPSTLVIEKQLSLLAKHYEQILIIPIAKQLSGTYDRIKGVAENLGLNYHIVDSRLSSIAQGLLVLKAAEWIAQQQPLPTILKQLETLIKKTRIYVAVEDINYMIQLGRISHTAGKIINLLRLKPIISLSPEGNGRVYGKAIGFKRAFNKIKKIAIQSKPQRYAIVHANNDSAAQQLAMELTHSLNQPPEYIMPVSSAIGIHAGPGCIAVGLIEEGV